MKCSLLFFDLILIGMFGLLLSYLFGKPVVLIGYLILFVIVVVIFYVCFFVKRFLRSKLSKIVFGLVQGFAILGMQLFLHASVYSPIYTIQETLASLDSYEKITYKYIVEEEVDPVWLIIARYKYQRCLPQKIFHVYFDFLPDRSLDEEFVVESTDAGLRSSRPFVNLAHKEKLKVTFMDYEIILTYRKGALKKEEIKDDDGNVRVVIVERRIISVERMPKYFSILGKYLEKKKYPIVEECKSKE